MSLKHLETHPSLPRVPQETIMVLLSHKSEIGYVGALIGMPQEFKLGSWSQKLEDCKNQNHIKSITYSR